MKKTGDEYFDSKEFRELLASYEEEASKGLIPFMDADDLADIADYYQFTGKEDKAMEVLKEAIALYPNATLPNIYLARKLLREGNLDEAMQYFSQIENTEDPDVFLFKIEFKIATGDVEVANKMVENEFKNIPDSECDNFIYDVAGTFADYGFIDLAYEWIRQAKNTDDDLYLEIVGRKCYGDGNYEKCIRFYNKLLDHNPFTKRYWCLLSDAQYAKGDYKGALESSEYAIAIDAKDPAALIAKASALAKLERGEEATKYFQKILEMFPDDIACLQSIGDICIKLRQFDKAILYIEKIAKSPSVDPVSRSMAYLDLAICYNSTQRSEKALELLEHIDVTSPIYIDALIIKGHIFMDMDDYKKATEPFAKAMKLTGNSPHVASRIMIVLLDCACYTTCYDLFKEYIEVLGEDCKVGYSQMARCCLMMKHFDEVLKYIEIAIKRNPEELKMVMGEFFPKGMPVKEYYNYAYKKIKDNNKK